MKKKEKGKDNKGKLKNMEKGKGKGKQKKSIMQRLMEASTTKKVAGGIAVAAALGGLYACSGGDQPQDPTTGAEVSDTSNGNTQDLTDKNSASCLTLKNAALLTTGLVGAGLAYKKYKSSKVDSSQPIRGTQKSSKRSKKTTPVNFAKKNMKLIAVVGVVILLALVFLYSSSEEKHVPDDFEEMVAQL